MGGSYGFPSWRDELDVDYSSLPVGGKKLRKVPIRTPDGGTREVIIEEGMDPRMVEDSLPGPVMPPTIQDIIAQEDSFGGKLSKALSFGMDPVGTVYGPDAHRQVVEDLVGPADNIPRPTYMGPFGTHDITPLLNAGRTVAEKGLQMASSPLTGYFGVPGVATSIPGRLAAGGFGAMAAKGGGEQLGEVMSLTQDQGVPWDDPEVVRALTSGALDLGMAPLAAAGALHGTPMARARAFESGVINPALERAAPKVEALARDLGYTDAPGLSRMAPEGPKKPGPVEPIVELRTDDKFTNNASGESATSIEALNRAKSEQAAGKQRGVVDRSGNFRPLMAEGVDYRVQPGESMVYRTPEGFETIESHAGGGGDLRAAMAKFKKPEPPGTAKVKPLREEPPPGEFEIDADNLGSLDDILGEINDPKTPSGASPSRIGELERIIGSDAPADVRLKAMMELEDLVPPEVKAETEAFFSERKKGTEAPSKPKPPEKDIDTVFKELDDSIRAQEKADEGKFRVDQHTYTGGGYERRGAFGTVEEALTEARKMTSDAKGVRVVDPEGKAHYLVGKGPETIARRTIPDAEPPRKFVPPEKPAAPPESPILKNINDVYDQMYGKGIRLKAAQLKEGREVFNALKERKALSTQEDLRAYLAERQGKTPTVEPSTEVPPKEPTEVPEVPKEAPSLEVQLRVAERQGKWSEVERLKKLMTSEPKPDLVKIAQEEAAKRPVEPAKNQAEVDAAHEKMLSESDPVGQAIADRQKREFAEMRAKTPAPVNPLVKKITEAAPREKLREVNPVKVLTGEVAEPKPVSPVKSPKVVKDVDTVSAKVEKETGVSPDRPPQLNTPEGQKFVKSLAKNLGVTEDVASRMVGGETVPGSQGTNASVGQGSGQGKGAGKIVPRAGKNVPAPSSGGPPSGQAPPGGTTPRLPPMKGKRPTLDILSWMRQRRSGDVLAEQTRRRFESTPKGVQAQVDFEAGKLNLPEVRKFLDRQHKLMRRAGVDVGYVENYLTHLWKESPKRVREVLGKRLGLKPGISMTRSIPTLAEGIQKGLTPKFENMSDVLSWYSRSVNKAIADRGFFEWLREQKQIKPAGKAPYDWVTLDPDRFPIRKWKGNTVQFKAPKEMATKINEYLYDPASDPRAFIQGLQGAAKFSSFLKNIRLAAGVPFTKLNMHSFSVMAHHVLTTPTVKGVPNIPRMIGRGLKDFGEMLDPRLHKWTNEELSRARMMQKYGPLTLSTEDHVFAPSIKGSLLARLKESKTPLGAFKTVIDRMFEEPLFQSHLPKMKLNVAWELQKEYRKGGMGRKQAMEAAGEVTNNMFGGLNLDEAGRSKIGQDLARILILAPDWLESNLKTVKAIAGSPLGRTPKEKTYRDFATNLLGVYVAGTILQKAMTGRWMHENNPGNQFSIYLGKNSDNGKDRYVKPFGAGLAGVRLIYDSAEAVARREDVGKFGELVRGRMAIPSGIAASTIFNKGPFGQPITKPADTLGGQLRSVGEFAAGQTVPQYVAGPVAALQGKISPELGLAQAVEFPYTEVNRRPPDEKRTTGGRSRRRRRR